jgi:hypothetical protein
MTTTAMTTYQLVDPKYPHNSRYVTFDPCAGGEVGLKYYHWRKFGQGRDPHDKLLDLWTTADTDGCGEPPRLLVKLPNDFGGDQFVPTHIARAVWSRLVELGWKVVERL